MEVKKKRKNLEGKFLSELKDSFKKQFPKGHWVKIPDTPFGSGYSGDKMRFTAKKPYDVFCCKDGKPWAIEAKKFSEGKSWPFNKVTEDQYNNLQEAKSSGMEAVAIVYIDHLPEKIAVAIFVPDISYESWKSMKLIIEDGEPVFSIPEIIQICNIIRWNKLQGRRVKDFGKWDCRFFGK